MWSPPHAAAAAFVLAALATLPYQGTEADVTPAPMNSDTKRRPSATLSKTYRRLHAPLPDLEQHNLTGNKITLKFPKDRGRENPLKSSRGGDFSKVPPARNHKRRRRSTKAEDGESRVASLPQLEIRTTASTLGPNLLETKAVSTLVTKRAGEDEMIAVAAALSASSPRYVAVDAPATSRTPVTSQMSTSVTSGRAERRRKPESNSGAAPLLNYIFDAYSSTHQHRIDRSGAGTMIAAQPAVEALVGSTARLDCKVDALHDKLVSWVRRKEESEPMQLLTTGTQKYTADERYSARFLAPDTWRLEISDVRASDAASYDCQLSAHPPRTARVLLRVPAVSVLIVDGAGARVTEQVCELGSTVALRCVVRGLRVEHGRALHWHWRDTLLNDDTTRGGISVRTELGPSGAESVLRLARVRAVDAGAYSCSVHAAALAPAHVTLHVIQGESLAELHAGRGDVISHSGGLLFLCMIHLRFYY